VVRAHDDAAQPAHSRRALEPSPSPVGAPANAQGTGLVRLLSKSIQLALGTVRVSALSISNAIRLRNRDGDGAQIRGDTGRLGLHGDLSRNRTGTAAPAAPATGAAACSA
jgi:hypothetical protein